MYKTVIMICFLFGLSSAQDHRQALSRHLESLRPMIKEQLHVKAKHELYLSEQRKLIQAGFNLEQTLLILKSKEFMAFQNQILNHPHVLQSIEQASQRLSNPSTILNHLLQHKTKQIDQQTMLKHENTTKHQGQINGYDANADRKSLKSKIVQWIKDKLFV